MEAARRSFAFSLALGDARTEVETVQVVPKPNLKEFQVTCTAPQYTHRPPESQDKTLNLNVPEGTQIEWRLVFDQPLAKAWMLMDKTARQPRVVLEPGGRAAKVVWTAEQPTAYRFGWRPKDYTFDFTDDVEYTVEVKADEPPRVEVLQPVSNERATPAWKGVVKYRASDDYGLLQARLVYWREEGKEQRRELGGLDGNPAEAQTEWRLKDSLPDLKAGETVFYSVEVCDNYPGAKGSHWTRSAVQTFTILSAEDYQQYIQGEREQINADLETIMRAEEQDAKGIQGVREKLQH